MISKHFYNNIPGSLSKSISKVQVVRTNGTAGTRKSKKFQGKSANKSLFEFAFLKSFALFFYKNSFIIISRFKIAKIKNKLKSQP